MKRLFQFLIFAAMACQIAPIFAQTNIAIPAASGGGIKLVLPNRLLGVSMDPSETYGPQQITANLLAANNFAPQTWNQTLVCASGTTTTAVSNIDANNQQNNFWQGAQITWETGALTGQSSTVTSSVGGIYPGGPNQSFVFSPAFTAGCSSGDMAFLHCNTPLSTCAGARNLVGLYYSGGASAAWDTTDLSPSSTSLQALEFIAPGSATATLPLQVDATLPALFGPTTWIHLNGTYTLTFRAKATAGTPTLSYSISRNATYYLNSSVTPTVNATPNVGWTNYSFSFSASETGAETPGVPVNFTATNGTVLLEDVALTEAPAGGNPTTYRNAVYQRLLALHPGTIRFMGGDQWGCGFDAMISTAETACGYGEDGNQGTPISVKLQDFLLLAASVGADAWWTFSYTADATYMANMAAYFNAPCSSGNSYATNRCNFLAGTPYAGMTWPQALAVHGKGHIYAEYGNEAWNFGNGTNIWENGGTNYGTALGQNVAAFKASPYYTGNMKIVADGFIAQAGVGGWNEGVLTAAVGHEPDMIDGAPYLYVTTTDTSSTAAIYLPMWAESTNFSLPTGWNYQLQNYAKTTFGVDGAIYETNCCGGTGITGITQAQIDQMGASTATAINQTLMMLLAARDAGIKVQNFYSLANAAAGYYTAPSIYSNATLNSLLYLPQYGMSLYMPGPGSSGTIDRPAGITMQMVNTAIGNNLNLLNTVQTGTPTYSQVDAQANPGSSALVTGNTTAGSPTITNVVVTAGTVGGGPTGTITGPGIPANTTVLNYNSGAATLGISQNATATATGQNFINNQYQVAANPAVPYVQAFGFGDGAGNYSLIVDNLNLTTNEAITFSGAAAPTGSCTKTVFGSPTNAIGDNNETVYMGGTPVVVQPTSTSYNCGSGGDTLAPFSMVTYTWSTSTAQTWYVRQDGAGRYDAARVTAGFTGAEIGCNGLYDAAYPGSGTNQNCAFGDFRFLYDDQTYGNRAWVIAGGDTVVVRGCAAITGNSTTAAKPAGPCRIGFDFQGPCSGAGCGAGYTWCYGGGGASSCGIPAPPAGTSGQPTVIEGGCYPSCSTGTPNTTTLRPNQSVLAELFGDFSVNTVFDLSATQYVLLDGLYLNTHATCIIHISPSVAPCSSSAPFSSYANEGIRRDPTTSNITLTDVLISGMEDSCLIGPMDGVETFNDVECAYNGFTGDNYDDGTHSQSGGTVTRTNFTSIWNGCEQYYGSSYAIPISYCADDSSSGDGDGTATPSSSHDTFVNTWETMAYNTQDGDDVGHNQDPGSAAWYDSISYGNEGGTFKSGGQSAIMVNNLSVGNCRRMLASIAGAPSTFNTYLSDACRAGGDGVGLNFLSGGTGETIQLYNNSIVSYGGTMIDVQIQGGGSCTGCVFSFQNNAVMGYTNPNYNSGAQPAMWNTVTPNSPTYNLYYNLSSCPASGTGEVCTSPLWVGQPATPTTDSGLDNFDFYPTNPGSPLIHGGGGGGLTPSTDYFGIATTSPPVIGAVNAMVAVSPVTIYGHPIFYGGLTIY